MRAFFLGVAVVCLAIPGLAAEIDQVEEIITSAEIKEECHLTLPEPAAEDGERIKEKLDAMGKAAWRKIWTELDEQEPSRHDENARRADYMLRKRIEAGMHKGRSLVAEQGCAALMPRAREVLEALLK